MSGLSAPELALRPRLSLFRPSFAVVDLGRMAANFRTLSSIVGPEVEVIPVVKADAYGHGAREAAPRLRREGARRFAVALAEEAVELRDAGIDDPIILLAVLSKAQIPTVFRCGLTPTVFTAEGIARLDEAARERGVTLPVHVKVDTGMGRIGFPPGEYDDAVRRLSGARALAVEGVFTNFAAADDPTSRLTEEQVDRLDAFVGRLTRAGVRSGIVHCGNSAATLRFPAGWKQAVRPGIGLYGAPAPALDPERRLSPVMSLETAVIQVKDVPAGTTIGYGATWKAARPSRIATVPVGYDDGYPRAMSNAARVLFDGGEGKVAGRVSMDMTSVDVTDVPGVEEGSPATLFGERAGREVRVTELAAIAGTISYEILCGTGRRLPRVFVEDGEVLSVRSRFLAGRGGPA